jgi:hypothetical protein
MGIFKFNKKRDVLDLNERYKKQQEKLAQMNSEINSSNSNSSDSNSSYGTESGLGFFANMANAANSNKNSDDGYADLTNSSSEENSFSGFEDKRKKLAKRLMDMTDKLEDLSNQIYHLSQRVEVLEKRIR